MLKLIRTHSFNWQMIYCISLFDCLAGLWQLQNKLIFHASRIRLIQEQFNIVERVINVNFRFWIHFMRRRISFNGQTWKTSPIFVINCQTHIKTFNWKLLCCCFDHIINNSHNKLTKNSKLFFDFTRKCITAKYLSFCNATALN